MSDRTMYAGDTSPDAKFELTDETGLLNLTTASALEAIFDGATHAFSGVAVPIDPAEADADGVHSWNCRYVFATNDTQFPDAYVPFVKVTWSPGKIETFPTGDTLTVLPAPTP